MGAGGCPTQAAGPTGVPGNLLASGRRPRGGMTMAATHYVPIDRVHFTWDVRHEPVLAVSTGDVVIVRTRDVSDNQVTPASTSSTLAALDWGRVYPLSGPIYMN